MPSPKTIHPALVGCGWVVIFAMALFSLIRTDVLNSFLPIGMFVTGLATVVGFAIVLAAVVALPIPIAFLSVIAFAMAILLSGIQVDERTHEQYGFCIAIVGLFGLVSRLRHWGWELGDPLKRSAKIRFTIVGNFMLMLGFALAFESARGRNAVFYPADRSLLLAGFICASAWFSLRAYRRFSTFLGILVSASPLATWAILEQFFSNEKDLLLVYNVFATVGWSTIVFGWMSLSGVVWTHKRPVESSEPASHGTSNQEHS